MSQTPLSLAGFQVILIGRFWVIAEASDGLRKSRPPPLPPMINLEIDYPTSCIPKKLQPGS